MNTLLNTAVETDKISKIIDTLISWGLNTGLKIIISVVILIVSFRIINVLGRKIEKRFTDDKFDKTVVRTLSYIGKVAVKCIVVICIVGYLGIDTSGMTALITSLGVCVGLAVNGALSNFAGGVLIIFTRPFKVDDYIEVEGADVSGTVEDIHIVCTKLRTPDNKVIYVPNGTLSNSSIINYSEKETRRVDFKFSISYDDDFEKAKELIMDILKANELVFSDPEPFVRVSEYAQSSVDIVARAWVKTNDYWTVKFDVLEEVKKKFDEHSITVPYNQLDLHIKNDSVKM